MEEILIPYIFQGIMAIVTAILTRAYTNMAKHLKEKDEETEAVKQGVRAILHMELYTESQRLMERGCVTTEDLRNVDRIYENYHKLGGNGTGTTLYKRILQLPLYDGKDDEDA